MMKRFFVLFLCLTIALSLVLTGCGETEQTAESSSIRTAPSTTMPQTGSGLSEAQPSASGQMTASVKELVVRFGREGAPFIMYMEDNSTAAAIANYVGTSDWQLPIYNYDESNVMQYYNIPSRYEIPDNSETVTQANAGDVFYSDPNRIVLYYHDAEISEEYTLIGTFDTTDDFISAVEDNPVQEGWGNKLVLISAAE